MTTPSLSDRARAFLDLAEKATPGPLGVVAVTAASACSIIRDLAARVAELETMMREIHEHE